MRNFRRKSGTLYLYDGDSLCLGFRDFAVAYAVDKNSSIQYTLHKYGEIEEVKKWLYQAKSKLLSAGADDLASELRIVVQKEELWPVELLNWMIACTGGVKKLVEHVEMIETIIDVEFK